MEAKPPAVGRFFEIKSYFNVIGSQFAPVQSHLKELYLKSQLQSFKTQLKNLIVQFKSKTRLKSCILGLSFVSDLAQVGNYFVTINHYYYYVSFDQQCSLILTVYE